VHLFGGACAPVGRVVSGPQSWQAACLRCLGSAHYREFVLLVATSAEASRKITQVPVSSSAVLWRQRVHEWNSEREVKGKRGWHW